MLKIKEITAKYDELNKVWRVVCEYEDGTNTVLGNTPTDTIVTGKQIGRAHV